MASKKPLRTIKPIRREDTKKFCENNSLKKVKKNIKEPEINVIE